MCSAGLTLTRFICIWLVLDYSYIRLVLLQDPDTSDNVSNLNDGQLKALLDEAITYKSPRDRHGKSEIFNVSTKNPAPIIFYLYKIQINLLGANFDVCV